MLGDSISMGVARLTKELYASEQRVALHGAPVNCGGFKLYDNDLLNWLGNCPWDLVQFNVGMHFHPTFPNWPKDYATRIEGVVNQIRQHSPLAHIVFALTTPSPYDSNATIPDKETCANYYLFHQAGWVEKQNDIVRSLAVELNIILNDRYSLIQPVLGEYQKPCDIHFLDPGYELMARQDWSVFASVLGL